MTRKYTFTVRSINCSTDCSSHPHDVAPVAFADDGRAAAVITGYDVYTNASERGVVSHQVDIYSARIASRYVNAHQIDAIIGTDERAGGSVVVTAGVG